MRNSPPFGILVLALSAIATVAVFAMPPEDVPEPITRDDGFAARFYEVDCRLAVKRSLIIDLAKGRRKLGDVAARFAEMDANQPEAEFAAEHFPGATAKERYCRLVIDFVDASMRDDGQRPVILSRLNRELAAVVDTGGDLPSVKSPH